jgi:hypothetical protein
VTKERALGGHAQYGYIAAKAGVFGEDCLSEASSAAARFGEKHRKQAVGGALFFGYFLLSKQKQSDSPTGEKEYLRQMLGFIAFSANLPAHATLAIGLTGK